MGFYVNLRGSIKESFRVFTTLLGGSWVVIRGVKSTVILVIIIVIIVTLLITQLITTHEPPSRP